MRNAIRTAGAPPMARSAWTFGVGEVTMRRFRARRRQGGGLDAPVSAVGPARGVGRTTPWPPRHRDVHSMSIPILHRDERLVVLDKPTGLLSVPGIGPEKADCLAARIAVTIPGARIVHRLDRDTSGVIVMALDADAHRELSRQFQDRETEKRYVAVVLGVPETTEGTIDLPIRKDLENPPRQRICHDHGRPSVTHWRLLEAAGDRARLELRPITGRSHQLRLHAREIGHPILGDDLYAPPEGLAMADRLLLHATMLGFTHPTDARPMVVTSDPPF